MEVSSTSGRGLSAPPSGGSLRRVLRSRRRRGVATSASLAAVGDLTGRTAAGVLQAGMMTGPAGAVLNLAMVSHSAAGVLMQHGSEAAWLTMASLFTLAASLGGAAYYLAGTMWEGLLEPLVMRPRTHGQLDPLVLHGVDVGDSRFLRRPSVRRAADFAAEAHRGQVRKTQEPYVAHCVHTALIVEGLLSPSENDERAEAAIIAALLHDVLDDTPVDEMEVEEEFGEVVASMVARVSQLSATNQLVRRRLRLAAAEQSSEEEALLRQMILTMVAEPLVILIKLADRLHNMRTVYALSPEKQRAVASETRTVWCSLAERLGMFALKSELEDLCFAVLQPKEYRTLRSALDELWGVSSIPERAVTPPDCCLTGDCDCVCDAGLVDLDGPADASVGVWGDGFAAVAAEVAAVPCGAAASSSGSISSASQGSNIVSWQGARGGGGTATSGAATTPATGTVSPPTAAAAVGVMAADPAAAQPAKPREAGGNSSSLKPSTSGAESSWLSPEQEEVQQLIQSVLPFDASTLNMKRLASGNLYGLEALARCAAKLLNEIQIEGLATGLNVTVQGRVKSLYSTFKKMARKGVPLSEVYDARALRVVVDDEDGRRESEAIATCYKLLPTVHRLYRRVPGEEDDYIAQPKGSGYQSLHTAVVGPGGVPMEIQIRTSNMHQDAEYGKAAHWAYKEKPTIALPGTNGAQAGRESIRPGHAVLAIMPGGQWRDGVVVRSEHHGLRLLVAVAGHRRSQVVGSVQAAPQEYRRLLAHVDGKGYHSAGQGDMRVSMELYTLCNDSKYHRLDAFGHKHPTIIVPLGEALEPSQAPGAEAGPSGPLSANADAEFLSERTRLLRSMLEWGKDLSSPQEAGVSPTTSTTSTANTSSSSTTTANLAIPALASYSQAARAPAAAAAGPSTALPDTVKPPKDVMVLVWPGGRIEQFPRGTTAGNVIQRLGYIEIQGSFPAPRTEGSPRQHMPPPPQQVRRLVNVNNRLVPEETPLSDGDLVVLSRELLKI